MGEPASQYRGEHGGAHMGGAHGGRTWGCKVPIMGPASEVRHPTIIRGHIPLAPRHSQRSPGRPAESRGGFFLTAR